MTEVLTIRPLTIRVSVTAGQTIAAAGGTATASKVSGPGSFVGSPTCTYTGGQQTASCTEIGRASGRERTEVSATATIPNEGDGAVTRTTDGSAGNSGPANKTWADAGI